MNILEKLQEKGFRITSQRKQVLQELYYHPLTVEDIYNQLKAKNVPINLTSVYRALQLFIEQDIISDVDFGDGKKRYELINEEKHHHHIICNSCGKVEDITLKNEDILLKEATYQSQFQISKHTLEFFGLCAHCQ